MRPSIQAALELAASLTRNNRFVEAVGIAERAINRATVEERHEIRQWLAARTHDFTGEGGQ
ncbi:hypothetical protein ACFV3R_15980 [Streptomyces sp. NPDC059740]|uniref:hypothetical protein n=1 Tax=Streptomyces sp. NPDC059740 TaxID=3346926 RepID=UPI00365685DE